MDCVDCALRVSARLPHLHGFSNVIVRVVRSCSSFSSRGFSPPLRLEVLEKILRRRRHGERLSEDGPVPGLGEGLVAEGGVCRGQGSLLGAPSGNVRFSSGGGGAYYGCSVLWCGLWCGLCGLYGLYWLYGVYGVYGVCERMCGTCVEGGV